MRRRKREGEACLKDGTWDLLLYMEVTVRNSPRWAEHPDKKHPELFLSQTLLSPPAPWIFMLGLKNGSSLSNNQVSKEHLSLNLPSCPNSASLTTLPLLESLCHIFCNQWAWMSIAWKRWLGAFCIDPTRRFFVKKKKLGGGFSVNAVATFNGNLQPGGYYSNFYIPCFFRSTIT